jgi:hypothetical protein
MPETTTEETADLCDRIYRDHALRQRVKAASHKRPDVAENAIMSLIAETYLDGVRDGASFGFATTVRKAFTDA